MRPAASRAGAPPLSASIPIEKNGSPQGVTSQATPWRDAGRQREVAAGNDRPGAREQEGGGEEGRLEESAHVPNRLTSFRAPRGGAARLHGVSSGTHYLV